MKRGRRPGIRLTDDEVNRLIRLISIDGITIGRVAKAIGFNNYFLLYNPLMRGTGCTPENHSKIIAYLKGEN